MNLKKATWLACATQLLALLGSTFQYFRLFQKLHWVDNQDFFIMQLLWLLAHAMLVLFFFVLGAEMKKS